MIARSLHEHEMKILMLVFDPSSRVYMMTGNTQQG